MSSAKYSSIPLIELPLTPSAVPPPYSAIDEEAGRPPCKDEKTTTKQDARADVVVDIPSQPKAIKAPAEPKPCNKCAKEPLVTRRSCFLDAVHFTLKYLSIGVFAYQCTFVIHTLYENRYSSWNQNASLAATYKTFIAAYACELVVTMVCLAFLPLWRLYRLAVPTCRKCLDWMPAMLGGYLGLVVVVYNCVMIYAIVHYKNNCSAITGSKSFTNATSINLPILANSTLACLNPDTELWYLALGQTYLPSLASNPGLYCC